MPSRSLTPFSTGVDLMNGDRVAQFDPATERTNRIARLQFRTPEELQAAQLRVERLRAARR